MPTVAVIGRLAASGYCVPPFNGIHTSFPSKTVMGQKPSSDDFLNPTVSSRGDHSQEVAASLLTPLSSAELGGNDVARSIDNIPSESMAIKEQSLLNPAQEREEPAVMQQTGPLETHLDATASYSM